MSRKYKGVSQWHRDRDARWYELYISGVPIFEIAQRFHFHQETVSNRIRHHKALIEEMKR